MFKAKKKKVINIIIIFVNVNVISNWHFFIVFNSSCKSDQIGHFLSTGITCDADMINISLLLLYWYRLIQNMTTFKKMIIFFFDNWLINLGKLGKIC